MDEFEKRYDIQEGEGTAAYHRGRQMFCIHRNKLFIAEAGLPYSHAVWFQKQGWMTPDDDRFMNENVRGVINSKGDVYFYIGYDFQVNREAETIFFRFLKELARKVNLRPESKIFGGAIKQEGGKEWPGKKYCGLVKDYL